VVKLAEMDQIYTYIDENFNDHVKAMQRFLRQPGISITGEGMQKSVEMLLKYLIELGAKNNESVAFKNGWPVIYGELDSKQPNAKTLLVYGMYDVMPVDPDKWVVPPFEAEIIDAQNIGLNSNMGDVLVARGAMNQRGPLLAFLKAVESIQNVTGDLPINLIFVIENEEELGSIHLKEFRDTYISKLQRADAAHYHRMAQNEQGHHVIYLGTRGCFEIELTVKGGDWGGPTERDLHSSDVAWIDHPSWRLVWALNCLTDTDGNVLVEGWFDDCRPSTDEEIELMTILREEFNEEDFKKRQGIKQFKRGQPAKELFEAYVLGPVLNIDGLVSGWIEPGIKTIMPQSATAKLDLRTVPNMKSETIIPLLRVHLDKHGFPEVEIKGATYYDWYRMSVKEPIIQAILRATETMGVRAQIWPSHVASFPGAVFTQPPLNLPFGTSGLGQGGRSHTTNEYITISGIKSCEKYSVALLYEFANM